MKITTYTHNGNTDLGLLIEDKIYSLNTIADNMNDFLSLGDSAMEKAKEIENSINSEPVNFSGENPKNFKKVNFKANLKKSRLIYLYSLNESGKPGFDIIYTIIIHE